MKKYLLVLTILLGSLTFAPQITYADCPDDEAGREIAKLFKVNTICTPNDFIIKIVNVILGIAAMTAVLFIALGGFRYIVAAQKGAGNETVSAAKNMITNAIIGLIIIILAYTIVTVVNNTVGQAGGAYNSPRSGPNSDGIALQGQNLTISST